MSKGAVADEGAGSSERSRRKQDGWGRSALLPVLLFGLACSDVEPLACPDCQLVLDTILTLGDEQQAPLLLDTEVLLSPSGEWFAAPVAERGRIAVLDSLGQFVRFVGRQGHGPGEFDDIRDMVAVGRDTIAVIHRRFDLLTASGEYGRRPMLPVDAIPSHMLAVSPQRWFLATPWRYPNPRLYLWTPDSLRVLVPPQTEGEPWFFQLARGSEDRVMALETTRSEMQIFDTLGRVTGKYDFPLSTERGHHPFHLGGMIVRNDTVFTQVWRWRGSPERNTNDVAVAEAAGQPDLEKILEANEHFLDVRHALTGQRIAFIPLPMLLGPFVDPQRVIAYGQDSVSVKVHVTRFAIRSR